MSFGWFVEPWDEYQFQHFFKRPALRRNKTYGEHHLSLVETKRRLRETFRSLHISKRSLPRLVVLLRFDSLSSPTPSPRRGTGVRDGQTTHCKLSLRENEVKRVNLYLPPTIQPDLLGIQRRVEVMRDKVLLICLPKSSGD